MYFFEDVQELDTQRVDALSCNVPAELQKNLVKCGTISRHHDIGEELSAVVSENMCTDSIHLNSFTHLGCVDYYKLACSFHARNTSLRTAWHPLLNFIQLLHHLHCLNLILELAAIGLNLDNEGHSIG